SCTSGRRLGARDVVILPPDAPTSLGEGEDVFVRRADEEVLDHILIHQTRAAHATTTATLFAVRGDRGAFDVARVGDADDHVLFGDQILDRELAFIAGDLGATLVAILVGDRLKIVADDLHAAGLRGEDLPQIPDKAYVLF